MEEIYRTGRGSFKVRSRWRYDAKENVIEIYEIPYTATAEAVMDKVAELVKAGKVKEISDMRDETDLGGLKLAIDLKRGADPEKLMAKLFKSTPLMDSFACNFNILIAGTPKVMGVREILGEWTAWRLDCVKRRVYFDLSRKQEKLHLLKGLGKILLDIDKAIDIIRNTEREADVVPNLMAGFGIDYADELPEDMDEEPVEDYPVRVFVSREGYLKKITPQSLRMSGEQKYKEGDGPAEEFDAANRSELLVFTDRQQVYKTRLADFEDSKASLLGVYLPGKLGMDEGERVLQVIDPGDYTGQLLLFFENGKAARLTLSAYETKTNRKKLLNAYSDKSPLVCILQLTEELEIAAFSTEGRAIIFSSALLAPKTSRSTQGVAVMTMKPKYKLSGARPLHETGIKNLSRYRVRSLPAAGALLRDEDRGEKQLSLLEE